MQNAAILYIEDTGGEIGPIIDANKKETGVDFFNPEENAQLYYLAFEHSTSVAF